MSEIITTAEELDALPVGTRYRDRMGDVGTIVRPGIVSYPETADVTTRYAARYLPATVLYRPDTPAPAPSDEDREALRDALAGWAVGSGYYATQVGTDEAGEMADAILAAGWTRSPQPAPSVSAKQVKEAVELTEWDEQRPTLPALAFLEALGIEVTP